MTTSGSVSGVTCDCKKDFGTKVVNDRFKVVGESAPASAGAKDEIVNVFVEGITAKASTGAKRVITRFLVPGVTCESM